MAQTFRWNSRFETGLADVDDQHRRLVDIVNAIGERIAEHQATDAAALAAVFEELREYAGYHFAEEEDLMATAGIAPRFLDLHRDQHHYYVREVERLAHMATPDDPGASQDMLEFLTSWLVYHILGVDQSMARQLRRMKDGMAPEAALIAEAEEEEQEAATEPLLHALHGLFDQVAARNRELEELNQSLERRVAERTAELTDLVEVLEREKAGSQRLGSELAAANRQLQALAMTDVLTGLPNRRQAMIRLVRLWLESGDPPAPLSVIMIDADGFKPVNDTYGHDAGDRVLKVLAAELQGTVRTDDLVCRLGGDEFLIVCPLTPLSGATQVARAARARVGDMRVAVGDGEWRGSISVGVAERRVAMGDVNDLIKAADEALYRAKTSGRDCVRLMPAAEDAPVTAAAGD